MSCLEMPRGPAPDFLGEKERTFNDADTMQPRAPSPVPADARNGARVKAKDVQPEGLYRPNYNVLTPNMRSPDYVQMSTAAAASICCSHTRKAAAPTAPIAVSRAIARRTATTPTATSSASIGRRCPTIR